MLFSNDQVAGYINDHFEPAWQSVRPVPTVTIDFGNGTKITRTLHGNVATYVCRADGSVLDVLPGIYEPKTYEARLEQLVLLHQAVSGDRPRMAVDLVDYHRQQAKALAAGEPPQRLVRRSMGASITGAELGVRITLEPARRIGARAAAAEGRWSNLAPKSTEDLAGWEELARDTEINEQVRRLKIHQYLAEKDSVAPKDITKWLYREVLHADLDDPYLGLGKVLFDGYPFEEEDAQRVGE